jgi:bifunctional non-homologous end joining protein LigD
VHEIKHDGYRLQVRRDGNAVRLFTRRGYDWSKRYPAITRTAAALQCTSFTIDREAVVCARMASPCSMLCTAAVPSARR